MKCTSVIPDEWSASYQFGAKSIATCNWNDAVIGSTSIMISCTPLSNWKSFLGSYIGTKGKNTVITHNSYCIAVDSGTKKTKATGICCSYRGSGMYQKYGNINANKLQCKTQWGSSQINDAVSVVECDTGYMVFGCSGIANGREALGEYYSDVYENKCRARSMHYQWTVRAVATCCRIVPDTPWTNYAFTNDDGNSGEISDVYISVYIAIGLLSGICLVMLIICLFCIRTRKLKNAIKEKIPDVENDGDDVDMDGNEDIDTNVVLEQEIEVTMTVPVEN